MNISDDVLDEARRTQRLPIRLLNLIGQILAMILFTVLSNAWFKVED